jgi:hypothetical protein
MKTITLGPGYSLREFRDDKDKLGDAVEGEDGFHAVAG